ncbi:T9SS type A sorting domain-containing protein [bacterium SCSIO 12741]|nr:T9SS type A sorting domain-containing protein [bacterium SCSIO 12741]
MKINTTFTRIWAFLVALVLTPAISWGQLVPNGSFESHSALPTTYGQIYLSTPWESATTDGTPEYFHRNASTGSPVWLPRTSMLEFGVQDVDINWGEAYAGINIGETASPLQNVDNWEYLSIPLDYGGLDPTKSYTVSFKVNIIDHDATHIGLVKPSIDIPVGGISAFLFNETTYPNLVLANRTTGVPLTSYVTNYPLAFEISNTSFIADEDNWVTVSGQVPVRPGGVVLDRLMIGSFLSEADLRSGAGIFLPSDPVGTYAFIDDVKIEVNSSTASACNCEDIEFSMAGSGPGCKELDISMPPGCQLDVDEIVVTVEGNLTSANKGGTITAGTDPGTEVITWDRDAYSGKYQFCFSGSTIGTVLIQLKDNAGNQLCRKMINCTCNGYEWTFEREYNSEDSSCCFNYKVKRIAENACEIYGFGIAGDVDFQIPYYAGNVILPNVGDELSSQTMVCMDKSATELDLELYNFTANPADGYDVQCSYNYELEDCPEACCDDIDIHLIRSPGNDPDCADIRAIFGNDACPSITAIRVIDNFFQIQNTVALSTSFPGNQHLGSYCCAHGSIFDYTIQFLNVQGEVVCHKRVSENCDDIQSCCDGIHPTTTAQATQTTPGIGIIDPDTIRCCWDINVPWIIGEHCDVAGWMVLDAGTPVPATAITFPNSNMGTFCSHNYTFDLGPLLAPGQVSTVELYLDQVLAVYDSNGDLLCTKPIRDTCELTFFGPPTGGGGFEQGKQGTTGIEDLIVDKENFKVAPNPTENRTTISYTLNKPSSIQLSLYNSAGELITIIEEGERETGDYSLSYDVSTLPMGIYYIFLQTNSERHSLPVQIIK